MKLYSQWSKVSAALALALSFAENEGKAMEVTSWPSTETDHSSLQVLLPHNLKKEGGYVHKDALFGYPAYMAGSLQVPLINAESTACEPINNVTHVNGPFALLIDRGGCHFVRKVRHAQHLGARAVLIADNTCLCSDTSCMEETQDDICQRNLPYMADDEMGDDVTIPSMLIRKSDADQIKKSMKMNKGSSNTVIRLDWNVPAPDDHVEWTLWQSSWDDQTMMTLNQLEEIVVALGDRATFTPRFVSYNGSDIGCHDDEESAHSIFNTICGNMCLNRGRYCLLDPSPMHDRDSGASGADVVTENLRRKCIWRITSKEDRGVGKKWWRYVKESGKECSQDETKFRDQSCFDNVMKRLDIKAEEVEKCMQPHGIRVNQINPLLEEELKEQTALELLRLPALYVDGVHARGRIDPINILSMICAGYGPNNPPAVCSCTSEPAASLSTCIQSGGKSLSLLAVSDGVSFGTLAFILMLVGATVAVAGFAYWRRTQSQMREQVRSILAEYMPMEDQALLADDGLESPRMHPAQVASAKSPRGYLPSHAFDEDGM